MEPRFYVYEHLRPDTGAVFYVGKGSGYRRRTTQGRNARWRAIVEAAGGFEVRMVAEGLDDELGDLVESERIDQLREMGVDLCNMTDGGKGLRGYQWPAESVERRSASQRGQKRPTVSAKLRGRPKSVEHRKALSAAKMGKKASPETRAKMSAVRKGKPGTMLGKRHRPESKAKISAAIRGERNPFYGRRHTEASRAAMSAAHVGSTASPETRAKMSAAHTGRKRWPIPGEQKARQIAALKARPRMTCPHCGGTFDEGNAKRWHFDNCRERR